MSVIAYKFSFVTTRGATTSIMSTINRGLYGVLMCILGVLSRHDATEASTLSISLQGHTSIQFNSFI